MGYKNFGLLTNDFINLSLVACIGDQDVATRVIAEGLRPEQTIVSKIMTRNPIFVTSDSLAIEALQKMIQGLVYIYIYIYLLVFLFVMLSFGGLVNLVFCCTMWLQIDTMIHGLTQSYKKGSSYICLK